jgi:NADPH:quinone reductase-like Zn-dependent oxidoreductase
MKAVVLHEYGPPKNLKYEDFEDPRPKAGEVLVRVHAAGVNPIDWKMRSGVMQEFFPLEFPAVLGFDFTGVVQELGDGVTGFAKGDSVFGYAPKAYAELCVVPAAILAKLPDRLEMTAAAGVPLVSATGDQLIRKATCVQKGQTILLTGATGSVGRCALFCALEIGAKVIAGVRKSQVDEAKALGAMEAIDLESDADIARLGKLDGVADTVGGPVSAKLLARVKEGGCYGSVLGPPQDANLHPTVKVNPMGAVPDAQTFVHYAEAVRDGKLKLPIALVLPLSEAAEAHKMGEKGGVGKIVLSA